MDLMREGTIAFQRAIEALERASGNPRTVAQLRVDLVTHVGRLNRLAPPKDRPALGCEDHVSAALERMPIVCRCDNV